VWTTPVELIKQLVRELGYVAVSAEDSIQAGFYLPEELKSFTEQCDFAIADITGANPNVMMELGICYGLGKPVIVIAKKEEVIPFDVRTIRMISYSESPSGLSLLRGRSLLRRFSAFFAVFTLRICVKQSLNSHIS
jgi:predicted nucleotide-binding protein